MASVQRRPRSKFWHGAWRDVSGKLHMRSTKEENRTKAQEVVNGWERAEHKARNESQVRKVMSEILERNTDQPLRTPSVREFLTDWLASKSLETGNRYAGVANAFYKHLGERADRPLKDVMPRDIQSYINEMRTVQASDKTTQLHLQALKSAFNYACKMLLLDMNPADPITVKVDDEEVREIFTPAEVKLIIDAAEGEWKTLIRLGYYTGLRLTTAACLRKDAIEMKGSDNLPVIKVAKPGKRAKPVMIPVHKDFITHLKKALASTAADEDYLLPSLAGAESGGKRGLSRTFKEIVIKSGVDMREITRPNGNKFCKRSFHSLRHGSTSDMANKGVSQELRMEITGHKTEREHARYTHIETETLRVAVDTMDAIPEGKPRVGTAKPAKKYPNPFRNRSKDSKSAP